MNQPLNNIVLIGMMGTGKSTVGSLLAAETGLALVDLDQRIVEEAGRTIPDIFAAEGKLIFASWNPRSCGVRCRNVALCWRPAAAPYFARRTAS